MLRLTASLLGALRLIGSTEGFGGRLIADAEVEDVLGASGRRVRVRTPEADVLAQLLGPPVEVARSGPDELEVSGLSAAELGDLAHAHGLRLHHLAEVETSLEHAYWSLTEESVEYRGEQVPEGALR